MQRHHLNTMLRMTGGYFALTFLVLGLFAGYSVYNMLRSEKRLLKAVSQGIADDVHALLPVEGPLPAEGVARIEEKLDFINGDDDMAFAVTTLDGNVLYRSPNFRVAAHPRFLRGAKDSRLFLLGLESEPGTRVEDLLKVWHFLLRHRESEFCVLVADRRNYELLEKTVVGFGVAVVLALLLAGGASWVYTRRILRPMSMIAETLSAVRRGELKARCSPTGLRHEIQALVCDLNQTLDTLDESFRRMADFSADVAHELKTPLTAIRGTIEICLARERPLEEYHSVLSDCLEETVHLTRIVEILLLMARPRQVDQSSGEAVELSAVVTEQTGRAKATADESGISLEPTIETGLSTTGDRVLLSRLVFNLLDNALKFTPTGGDIQVSLRRQDDEACLEVRDSGPGIAPEHLPRIFDRFYQVHESRGQGVGLGLPLAQWIAVYHRGTIVVASEPGKGTCFTVRLPLEMPLGGRVTAKLFAKPGVHPR